MKKKLQKYLSGEREGFSLVELIIVIAIMAILIGIIALAVIPYMEKSRVGKDQQTVDTVYSAYQSAIAEIQSKGGSPEDITLPITGTVTDFGTALLTNLGGDPAKKGQDICDKLISAGTDTNDKIVCTYNSTTKEILVKADGATADGGIQSSNKK